MNLENLSLGSGALIALLGYCVVFLGIVMLLFVVLLMIRVMNAKTAKQAAANPVPDPVEPVTVIPAKAPGTAGDLKLYDTDPRDAAMIMAIVADKLGKPLNELRFISIKEVKNDEI